ncbi:MAG: hypothetical protein IJ638_00220 [Alphaproteobacteria bacterium]|nr:hypothetical protein [Alphaproteobacteria bacterium]
MNKKISLLAVLSLLTACGGSGSGSPAETLSGEKIGATEISSLQKLTLTTLDPEDPIEITENGTFKYTQNHSDGTTDEYEFTNLLKQANGTIKAETTVDWEDEDDEFGKFSGTNKAVLTLDGERTGLSYAQFGTINEQVVAVSNSAVLKGHDLPLPTEGSAFFGGNDDYEIDRSNITKEMTFEGNALGYATYDDAEDFAHSVDLDGKATLVVDKDSEKLSLKFDNFYDVNYDSSDRTIEFVNAKDGMDKGFETAFSNINGKNFATRYYGDSADNITEVSGMINAFGDDAEFEASFGAKKAE